MIQNAKTSLNQTDFPLPISELPHGYGKVPVSRGKQLCRLREVFDISKLLAIICVTGLWLKGVADLLT
jgi:hypothetical protein